MVSKQKIFASYWKVPLTRQKADMITKYRYKNGMRDGKVWGPWPGSSLHYLEVLSTPRWEHYNIKYLGKNRVAYFGVGRTKREKEGGDLAYYLREPWS